MAFPNPLGLPVEIIGIVQHSHTVEYASLTKAGVPITFPVSPYVAADGRTLDVQTGLAYTAKAQRARNQPKVCLLYSEPLGSGLDNPPAVLVYGHATVHDADLQANTDRYVRLAIERYPEAYGRFPSFLLKTMGWYFARIWIKVTPLRVLWWPGGDLSQTPKTWQAPPGTEAPPSDPSPTGKGLKRWDKPPAEWRSEAEYAVQSLGKPILTTVDSDGYPVPARVRAVSLNSTGFRLQPWPAMPAPAQGKACLTFHRHDEKFSWQENMVFVGEIKEGAGSANFQVERRLTSVSFKEGSQLETMLYFFKLRRQLAPRLRREAERRGQTVPKVRLLSMDTQSNQSGIAVWGWGTLLAISVLVALNGVGWFFMGPSLSTFEQDTGVPLSEFRQAYPTVAELVSLQASNTAILLTGFGLLALAVALGGRRGGAGSPRWAGWAFAATLASIGLSELAAGAVFGLFYLALGVAALVGQLLARTEPTSQAGAKG